MKIVCDTNVLLSGLIWGGHPGRILDRVEAGTDRLCVSRVMLEELVRVLEYPRLQKALHARRLTTRDIVSAAAASADIAWPRPLPETVIKEDPGDDAVLACALAAGADAIVSGDRHLLALKEWNGIRICSPATYLNEMAAPGTITP
jgi:putative PIN family toxin of toxin-antitoxin system